MADPIIDNGHWFTDGFQLFIVPPGIQEIIGPDDAVIDSLNAIYRSSPFETIDSALVASTVGLEEVPHVLRRKFGTRYFSA